MTLKYNLRKKKCSLTQNEYKYYAQVVKMGDYTFEELVQEIASRSAVSVGDVVGVLRSMVEVSANQLSEGKRVHISHLGSFMARVSSEPLTHFEDTRQVKIRTKNVQFTPSRYLQHHIASTPTQRICPAFRNEDSLQVDEICLKQQLITALHQKDIITRPEYGRLTGRLRFKAQQDLNQFVAEGWLEKCGKKPLIYYRLKQK